MSTLFPQPAPSFDDPIGMLEACHGRILGNCDLLARIVEHIRRGDTGEAVRTGAGKIVRYFTTAGPHHHADEEEDLFPRLRGRDAALDEALAALEREHVTMHERWAALEPALREPETITDADDFARRVEAFDAIYRAHIERENNDVLPRARALLEAEEIKAIGAAMAARRGVELD